MDSNIIQRFKGVINEVEFEQMDLYYATETILQGIEDFKDIVVNDSTLTADIKDALKDYCCTTGDFIDLEEVGYATYNNLTDKRTLRDVRLCDTYGDDLSGSYFKKINELTQKLANGNYDYLIK